MNSHNINNCFKQKNAANNSSRFHNDLQDENVCNSENERCLFVVDNSNNQDNYT